MAATELAVVVSVMASATGKLLRCAVIKQSYCRPTKTVVEAIKLVFVWEWSIKFFCDSFCFHDFSNFEKKLMIQFTLSK